MLNDNERAEMIASLDCCCEYSNEVRLVCLKCALSESDYDPTIKYQTTKDDPFGEHVKTTYYDNSGSPFTEWEPQS